jgi:hypothetical protein
MSMHHAFGDQPGCRVTNLVRERDPARGRATGDGVKPVRMERVHEHREPEALGLGEERCVPGVVEWHAADVRSDLHPAQSGVGDFGEHRRRTFGVLQGHGTERLEATAPLHDLCREPGIHLTRVRGRRRRVRPIAEELGHGREHLALDTVRAHLLGPALEIPCRRGHGPEVH